MIGLVVVSHSRALAQAAVALAAQMLPGPDAVPIAIAAGLDAETFGTDAVAIAEAIEQADRGDGVVVLMDLGSAVLSAELALELLPDDELRERVTLCPAPLVEGLVVAAVTALSGAPRAQVAAEAEAALQAKQESLPHLQAPAAPAPPPRDHGNFRTASFTVTPAHGLHARPAAKLVRLLQGFDAEVELRNATTISPWVPGASLSRIATLAARAGHRVELRATGPGAEPAAVAVLALAERGFDETETETETNTEPPAAEPEPGLGPYPASPGIGIGPATQLERGTDPAAVAREPGTGPEQERDRLSSALGATDAEIAALGARLAGRPEAEIFDAHRALLADPDLLAGATDRIDEGWSAASAWAAVANAAAGALDALPDEYLRARAADIRAVAGQVLDQLRPGTRRPEASGTSGVLVAADLTPAQAAGLDPALVVGVVLAGGSPTTHSAILLRGRGIPAVVGAGPGVLEIAAGRTLVVDGTAGTLALDPPPAALAQYQDQARQARDRHRAALQRAGDPAASTDGTRILVGANLGSVADAAAARAAGADFVGLVRTEFLFLGRQGAPDVDEQEAAYRALAAELPGCRLTLRTLDVGGDKPLPYLPVATEANPFLGVRGLRLALARPELLADQLLAMVRLAHDAPVGIMFPMVTALAELVAARQAVDAAVAREGRGRPAGLEIGIMVEVPAAALKAAVFAPHVDFFSIGTNDLTQYTLAAERGNQALAGLADPLDPAVLRLIDLTARAAGPHGVTVAVCGELAADEQATGLLVGLGVRELSVAPAAVPGVKQAVRTITRSAAEQAAAGALIADSAAAVRALRR